MKIIFVIAAVLIFKEASAFPTGAPKKSCHNMTPKHHHHVPQTSASPVKFVLSKTQIASTGETISVRIESIDPSFTFKGFMIQARDEADIDAIVGVISTEEADTKVLDCDGPNTATHIRPDPKTSASLNWQPDGFTGKIRFHLTIVQDFKTFWVGITSEVVEISS